MSNEKKYGDPIGAAIREYADKRRKLNMHMEDDPQAIIDQIQTIVLQQQNEFNRIWDGILKELKKEKIFLINEKQLNKEHLSVSSKIESILSHLSTIGNESKWFEIIDGFKDIISNHDPMNQSQKRDVLRSIIDHIKVSFDGINKTHQLDVNFRIPMVYVILA